MSLSFCLDQTTTYIAFDTLADDAMIRDGCYKMHGVVYSMRIPFALTLWDISSVQ